MPDFSYIVEGEHIYEGRVRADTPRDALQAALAAVFGGWTALPAGLPETANRTKIDVTPSHRITVEVEPE